MQRKRGLEIGRPLGSRLLVHGSWFPAGALLVAHLTISAYGGHDLFGSVLLSIATTLVFFVCVAFKEVAQALVARLVRAPFSDVTLYVFGGIARSSREATRPIQDLVVAAAGPAASGVLGFIALTTSHGLRGIPGDVMWTIGVANIALAATNLLPGSPLDGGRAVAAILTGRTRNRPAAEITAARAGQLLGALAVIAGAVVIALTHSSTTGVAIGIWLVVGGIIVAVCASRERRAAVALKRIGGATAGEWAKPFAGRVTLDGALPSSGTFAVADSGRLAGVASGRSGESVRAAMVPWTSDIAVRSTEPVTRALGRLARGSVVVVLDENGTVRGVLDPSMVEERL